MRNSATIASLSVLFLLASAPALANEVEGEIEAVDAVTKTLNVQGIDFVVTDETDFDDDAEEFGDLKLGQDVEVDFEYRQGKHIATEVEVDD